MNEDKYILSLESPHSAPIQKTYEPACREILIPFQSTHLDDFPRISKLIGGFRPREFTLLCGSTGSGKTTLAANFSASWLKQGVPHFVASVETGHTDYVKRIMSVLANEDWNTGDPVPIEQVKQLDAKYRHLFMGDKLWLSLYDNRFSVETLMSDIAWHVKHKQCKIAIIDNLNFFLEVTSAADTIVEMDRVIHSLIIFCKQIDVHCVMITHPKKTPDGRVSNEFDIKGSSTAVQEAHNILLFNRAGEDLVEQKLAEPNDREIKIAKMRRRGRAAGRRIVLASTNGVKYHEGVVV